MPFSVFSSIPAHTMWINEVVLVINFGFWGKLQGFKSLCLGRMRRGRNVVGREEELSSSCLLRGKSLSDSEPRLPWTLNVDVLLLYYSARTQIGSVFSSIFPFDRSSRERTLATSTFSTYWLHLYINFLGSDHFISFCLSLLELASRYGSGYGYEQ